MQLWKKMARASLAVREELFMLDRTTTFNGIDILGGVLRAQGNNKEAESLHRRALVGRETLLGVEHPSTLTSVNHFAEIL